MKRLKRVLAAVALMFAFGAVAQAQTYVTLSKPAGYFLPTVSVSCAATYWDAAGVIPSGACRAAGKATGGSGRGGGYVKPPYTLYAVTWDLFGNGTVLAMCGHRNQWVSYPPAVEYYNGYTAATCNADLVDHNVAMAGPSGYFYYTWIGPSLAGEYVIGGVYLLLP